MLWGRPRLPARLSLAQSPAHSLSSLASDPAAHAWQSHPSRACHRAVLDALVTRCSHRCMGDWRRAQITAGAIATLVSLGGGCGAKTGLKIPCTTRFVPDAPEIMFVIDRSASMGEINSEGETHWTALDRALRTVIPQLQGVARVGMAFYPRGSFGRERCRADPVAAQSPTEDLIRLMSEFPSSPVQSGGTPTFEGLLAAAAAHRQRRVSDPTRSRFVVLATDGGAACNFEHSLDRCTCLIPSSVEACRMGPTFPDSCLDDERMAMFVRPSITAQMIRFIRGNYREFCRNQ